MKKNINTLWIAALSLMTIGCGATGGTTQSGLLPPQNVQVTLTDSHDIEVKWTNPEYAAGYFVVLEKKLSTDGEFAQESTMDSSAVEHQVDMPTAIYSTRTYVFRMKSIASAEESAYSPEISIEVPVTLVAEPAVPVGGDPF